MRNSFISLASAVSLLISIQVCANNYVWIHGFKNDDNCWKLYDNTYTQNVGTRVKYLFSNNAQTTSENVWKDYNLNNRTDNILIGYSVGGLVAREMEFNHSSKIKGIITIGTPQSGVPVKNGECAAIEGYSFFRARLYEAIQATALTTVPIIGNAVMDAVFRNSEEKYVKNLPYYSEYNPIYHSTLEKDFFENSSYMKSIESKTTNAPILCFAAEEDRWQLGRMLYCSRGMTDLQTNLSLNADGNYDQAGYNELNTMARNCNAMGVTHTVLAAGSAVAAFFWWPAAILVVSNTVAAAAWYDANNYINNSLDYNQALFLGAYHTQETIEYHRFLFWKWTTSKFINVPDAHDGFASVKSQYLAVNKGRNVIIPPATIKNVNHMEEFNHKNTRIEFNKAIVEGGYGNGIFKK